MAPRTRPLAAVTSGQRAATPLGCRAGCLVGFDYGEPPPALRHNRGSPGPDTAGRWLGRFPSAADSGTTRNFAVTKTDRMACDADSRKYRVLREHYTERAFSSPLES